MNKVQIIQWYIDSINAKTYLEIGVRHGESFIPINCQTKIGVDVVISDSLSGHGVFFEMSSDEFFEKNSIRFDVAFIDGDHTYEQSLRDVENCLKVMNPRGVILLHDCNPTCPEMATSSFVGASPDWCGEVWKTVVNLRTRLGLDVLVFRDDFGIGVIKKGRQDVLNLAVDEIARLTYDDLAANRNNYLNLV